MSTECAVSALLPEPPSQGSGTRPFWDSSFQHPEPSCLGPGGPPGWAGPAPQPVWMGRGPSGGWGPPPTAVPCPGPSGSGIVTLDLGIVELVTGNLPAQLFHFQGPTRSESPQERVQGTAGQAGRPPQRHAAYPARHGGAGAFLELGVRGEALPDDVGSIVLGSQPRAAFEDKIDEEKLDSGVEAWGTNEVPAHQDPAAPPEWPACSPCPAWGPSAPWRASRDPSAGRWSWEGDTQGRAGTPAEREAFLGAVISSPEVTQATR